MSAEASLQDTSGQAEESQRVVRVDARGLHYRPLNERIRRAVAGGAQEIVVENVCGQRYIGTGLRRKVRIEVLGTPGNDLGAFMDGPTIVVRGNAQDGTGNTQTGGEIVVHGSAGDVLAHSLRGGSVHVRGSAGSWCAIHMKQFTEPVPVVVVGGTVGDYAGEYMAGGILIVLGLDRSEGAPLTGRLLGTGMHNGVIYLRGDIADYQMGREISRGELDEGDRQRLRGCVGRFAEQFSLDAERILGVPFVKFAATSVRPYGRLYVY